MFLLPGDELSKIVDVQMKKWTENVGVVTLEVLLDRMGKSKLPPNSYCSVHIRAHTRLILEGPKSGLVVKSKNAF